MMPAGYTRNDFDNKLLTYKETKNMASRLTRPGNAQALSKSLSKDIVEKNGWICDTARKICTPA